MAEMHLKQPGFTYSACGPFTKELKSFCRLKTDFVYRKLAW